MVLKNSVFIGIFGVISILLGIFRDRLLAEFVGIGSNLDIYNAAFRLPDLTLGVMLSFAASATVIPFISKAVHAGDREELSKRFSTLFLFFGGVMAILAILVSAALPLFAHLIVPGFSSEQTAEYIFFTRILMFQPILLGLSTLISTLAQVKHQFFLYLVAPLVYTLGIILGIVFGYPKYGVGGILLGVVLGAVAHIAIQSITLYQNKLSIKLENFRWSLIKEHLRVSVPRSGSFIISQLRMVFFASFATTFGIGALSIYLFAQRIGDAALQVLPQSISTASMPSLSKHLSSGNFEKYKSDFVRQVTVIFWAGVGIAIVCIVFPDTLVRVLYGETGYTKEIASFLVIFALSLPFSAVNNYIGVAFSALKDTKSLFMINIISTPIAILCAYIGKAQGFGLASIAYGIGIGTFAYTALITLRYITIKHKLFKYHEY